MIIYLIKKNIYSMLDVLDFYEAAKNYRTRCVYKKNGGNI